MNDTTPKWAFDRAERMASDVCLAEDAHILDRGHWFKAFAAYIAEYEQPPVDPLMVAAREIVATTQHNWPDSPWHLNQVARLRVGAEDKSLVVMAAYEGIKRGMELAK